MLFNSLSFLVFFIIVFFLYYFPLKEKIKAQNWLLLIASYFFYSYADWRMIPLIFIASVIFYFLGLAIKTSTDKKASLLTTLGVFLGVGLLLYFKYFNFFIDSFIELFNAVGLKTNLGSFNIILPLGISFFTFRIISYVMEVYRGKIEPTQDFIVFATYVAFFPTIMSGPIDRPNTFIPQLENKRIFNNDLAVDGFRQILWGLFQKVVIADHLAVIVNLVWSDISSQSGSTLIITAFLYSFQIYTDFSGYSHMAIGVGKILGFRITKNFNYPYFSRTIAEFWRKWHISLTSWFTDYVFMPLNIKFRNLGNLGILLAITINLVLVGMWHGAYWKFAIFGLFHGVLFIPIILSGGIFKNKKLKTNKFDLPSVADFVRIIRTFSLLTFSLIIFKAENTSQAFTYIINIINDIISKNGYIQTYNFVYWKLGLFIPIVLVVFFGVEWFGRKNEFPIQNISNKLPRIVRWSIYSIIIFLIGMVMLSEESSFIYFQF